jgi:hypothetical protein
MVNYPVHIQKIQRFIIIRNFKGQARQTFLFFKPGKILKNLFFYFSVDFLSFLYYIKILNSAGKFIFRCCPRRKRLFARGSKKEVSGAKKDALEK